MVGMPTTNANSVAAARLVVPASRATKMVAALREVPGNTPATTWATPTRIAVVHEIAVRSPSRAAREGERIAISWTTAVLVGIAQVVAGVFPGTSRSAATIFVALLAGTTSRAAATEFAFVVGIPTMFAATGYELLSLLKDGGIAGEDWSALGIAFVASAVTAFIAVKWLLRYIQSHRFTAFAVYRLAVGIALLLWLPTGS